MIQKLFNLLGTRRRGKSPYNPSGVTGVREHSGYVITDERNPKVAGRRRYTTYSNILANISVVAASVRHFNTLTASARWSFESTNDRMADLAQRIVDDPELSWRRMVKRAAMYRFYGFSLHEVVMERKPDGVILPNLIAPRAQNTIERWDLDEETGDFRGVDQRNPNNGKMIYLPRSKLLHVVDDSLNASPEGLGLFRHLIEPVERLADLQRLEWVGFETDLRGVLVAKVPLAALRNAVTEGTITQEQMDARVKSVKDFAENHIRGKETAIILDSGVYHSVDEAARPSTQPQWDVDLLRAGATSLPDLEKAIERIQRELARILGTEQLMLGEGAGSFALAQDKTASFFLIVDGALADIAEAVNRDVFGAVRRINGIGEDDVLRIKTETTWIHNPKLIAETVEKIKKAGAMIPPNAAMIRELLEMIGLTPPTTEEIDSYLQMMHERAMAERSTPDAV